MKRTLLSLFIASTLLAPASAVTLVNPSFEDLSASYVNLPDADRMTSVTRTRVRMR